MVREDFSKLHFNCLSQRRRLRKLFCLFIFVPAHIVCKKWQKEKKVLGVRHHCAITRISVLFSAKRRKNVHGAESLCAMIMMRTASLLGRARLHSTPNCLLFARAPHCSASRRGNFSTSSLSSPRSNTESRSRMGKMPLTAQKLF